MLMPAVSVRQPWAWLLLHDKDVENRSWALPERYVGKPAPEAPDVDVLALAQEVVTP